MIKAIVFKSQTGHTKQYAEILREKTNLPVYKLTAATKELPKGTEIVYLGWLMASTVQGYKKTGKFFVVKAVCGIGMSDGDSQLTDMRKSNHIPDSMPAFYLQGGFELDKLHGIYKLMMKTMPVVISMFGGWAFCIVLGFGCFFLAKIAPVWAVLCAYILLFLILWLVLHRWLKKKGTEIFTSL